MKKLLCFAMLVLAAGAGAQDLTAVWHGDGFTLENRSAEALGADWEIWVNGLPRVTDQPADAPVRVVDAGGTLSTMHPTEYYRPLAAGQSMEIRWKWSEPRSNIALPEGMFIVRGAGSDGRGGRVTPIPVSSKRVFPPDNGRVEYERNAEVAPVELGQADLIPSVKRVEAAEGTATIGRTVCVSGDFPAEVELVAGALADMGAKTSAKRGTPVRLVRDAGVENPEGYRLAIAGGGITISASTAAGAFYGGLTLITMLHNNALAANAKLPALPQKLAAMTVEDWPDFAFRGEHFDTARNYTGKENVLKLIDLMSSYKLNVLHFHFSDDEGWRIAIPGLPELTEVGARRGYTTDESDMLVPAYSGGGDPATAIGTGFLTREDYINLLRYATARHIRVIPEIESPGHARAAIKAMEARYNRYKDSDPARAEEFRLAEPEDKSVYRSVQDFDDNVMNVALPGTYRFMEKVVDELVKMHAEAGAPLETIHVGGDEVPRGVWTASPAAAAFMAAEGIENTTELADYYVLRVNEILKARGLKIAGWQELVEGRSEKFRAAIKDNLAFVNVWSTNGRQGEVPYKLVNEGYPVVLSNVGSLYLDLAYSRHPDERGQSWGGYVDAQRPFAMQPYNVYASIWRGDDGRLVDNSAAGEGLAHASTEAEKLIIGVQGQLWAEQIRGFDTASRFLLPKLPGVAERGWNSRPEWRCGKCFLREWSRHVAVMNEREMPRWASARLAFRLPPPGVYVSDGLLYANSMIPGAEIRYTTDGTEPTLASPLWTQPVECDAAWVEARIFYLGQASVSSAWDGTKNSRMAAEN